MTRAFPSHTARWTLVLLGVLLCLASPAALAQEIRYLYDDLNRLVGVVDQEGNAAEYSYDATGNLLQIKRTDVPAGASLAITLVSPNKGSVGTPVQLFGTGFSASPGDNQVAFTGTAATVTAATATSLTTTVPTGATTGPLTVTVSTNTATAPEPFTVLQGFAVVPDRATVLLGTPYSFQATLAGTPTSAVTWRVTGIAGGSATLGTISPAGLYTAPTTLPPVSPLTIEAVLTADPTRVATAQINLLPAGAGGLTTASVSVARREAAAQANPLLSPAVSLQRSEAPATATPLVSPAVALSREPIITGLVPSRAAQGMTTVALTIAGAGLTGASALSFFLNGVPDGTISVTGLTASPEGTAATALLSIAPSAPLGDRLVTITTPAGPSPNLGLGSNRFTVTP